jgi:putative pyruvate formate lyase activating enzyme
VPAYLSLHKSGELARRAAEALRHLGACDLCPRYCGQNRYERAGACRVGRWAWVAAFHPHRGEEPPLSGWRGSGTIFFSGCNLRCQYCQNFEISQALTGRALGARQLAEIMLRLQAQGCHNINLVSPSHVIAQILEALTCAAAGGLSLPLVYNTGGYDSPEALALLDGVVDVYMPDLKYSRAETGKLLSRVADYPTINQAAVLEMHRQVGDLVLSEEGLALHGLIARHLVLPNGLAGTPEVLTFLAEQVSTNTYLNLMDQYRPAFRAQEIPRLNRRISRAEYEQAEAMADQLGLTRRTR